MNTIPAGRQDFGKLCVLTLVLFLAACGGGGGSSLSANAGADQTVNDAATVTLDGSGSSGASSFAWTQTAGPDVVLSNASAQQPTFTAPTVSGGTTLTFTLTVSKGSSSATDSVTVTVNDVTASASTANISPGTDFGIRENIVITFDEAMDPASLVLGGDFAAMSDGGVWSNSNKTLTISPDEHGAWESGSRALSLTVDDASGNTSNVDASVDINLDFTTFQAANVVIGQANFTGNAANQGGTADANTLSFGYDVSWDETSGYLYVADFNNNRVLGFDGVPTASNANADVVIGQDDFTTTTLGLSATKLDGPYLLTAANGKLFVNDYDNTRIVIYDPAPTGAGAAIDTVIGQVNKTSNVNGCTDSNFLAIESTGVTPDGKVLVQDWGQDRALVFDAVPATDGASADLVLGQDDFVTCNNNPAASASSLNDHGGVWTDGEKLVMLSYGNHRAMIWNEFPTSNNQAADVVLGQPDFVTVNTNDPDTGAKSARTLRPYSGVWSNGLQLMIVDYAANRVLIWNTFPTTNYAPADIVIGQGDFTHTSANDDDQSGAADTDPTARTFNGAQGFVVARDKLVVADTDNNRVLVFESN